MKVMAQMMETATTTRLNGVFECFGRCAVLAVGLSALPLVLVRRADVRLQLWELRKQIDARVLLPSLRGPRADVCARLAKSCV